MLKLDENVGVNILADFIELHQGGITNCFCNTINVVHAFGPFITLYFMMLILTDACLTHIVMKARVVASEIFFRYGRHCCGHYKCSHIITLELSTYKH